MSQAKKNNENLVKTSTINFLSEDKISIYLLLVLILLVYVIRSKFVNIPFERDEGAYGYYGKLLLEGKIPYKDFYEQKFPGIFYFFGLMVAIFGDTVRGLHTGFTFLNIATIILIFLTSKKLFSPFSAILSATTFAIVSLTPNLSGFTIQSEHGVAFFTSLGLFFYAYAVDTRKMVYYLSMGLAFGGAFMVKTSGMFMVLWGGFILIINWLFEKEKKVLDIIKILAIYSGGVLFVIGVLFLIIYLKGSFEQMIFWTYNIPKKYVSKVPFEEGVKYFKYTRDSILANYKFFWYHALLAMPLCFLKSINWRTKIFAISLAVFSAFTIIPGFYFYGHYWIQLIPGLAILAGLTSYAVLKSTLALLKIKGNQLKFIYIGVFIIVIFVHLDGQKSYYFKPNYDRILRAVYGNNPFPESMVIANYINNNSKPEDQIVVMGSEPQIYFYTHKKCPSRHAYFAAIVDNIPEHKQWQREFVADIEKAKPRYFIFFNHPISLFVQPNTDKYVFDWANKYVTENYQIIGLADMIDGGLTNYVWKEGLNNYKPQGQNMIYIYERKSTLK